MVQVPDELSRFRTTQCPHCLYLAPLPGFIGICPKCARDTVEEIARIRNYVPKWGSGELTGELTRCERSARRREGAGA